MSQRSILVAGLAMGLVALAGLAFETQSTPAQAQSSSYVQFVGLAQNSGINLGAHPTYTADYVQNRVGLYCQLLSQGEFMKVIKEITYPPVVHWTETTADRSRLEVAIMRVGVQNACPALENQERQVEATVVR